MVFARKQGTVLACGLLMLQLRRVRSTVRLVREGCLLGRWAGGDSASAAVKCDVRVIVYDDGLVVDIRHVGDIHIGHRAVIEELAAAPFSAHESFSEESEPVVDAAIETNVRAPIAGIPNIEAIVPTPISGGPQIAHFGS